MNTHFIKKGGHDAEIIIIDLREPDLEMIMADILIKIHDEYINN